MTLGPLPAGTQRAARLRDRVANVRTAVGAVRAAMPEINDPDLRPRIESIILAAEAGLAAHADSAGPAVADVLDTILAGIRLLDLPAQDPGLEASSPTLERLSQVLGVLGMRLLNALDAAKSLGWQPTTPELPLQMPPMVSRSEAGTALDRLADRLDDLARSVDRLEHASRESPSNPGPTDLVNFYAGEVRVEIALARMELKVGEETVDFAALWRIGETVFDLTRDLLATLEVWAERVATAVREAAKGVVRPVRRLLAGVSAVARFVSRDRRKIAGNSTPVVDHDALHGIESLAADEKVADLDTALARIAGWRRAGLRVGFTNGTFDLIHPGHVRLLARARARCDRLVVGLNTDASVRRMKGPDRPVVSETARATVMAAMAAADLVVLFDEDSPLRLIEAIRPDLLFKGADYRIEQVVGGEFVIAHGGRVELIPLEEGHSTSNTIRRINSGS